jgi:uncharacterized membrane protein YgdD (TMEM256/DUF423 family)
LGAVFICLGITLGAFGAHSLKGILTYDELNSFEVGVRYQIYHGIALLVLGLNSKKIALNSFCFSAFMSGTILFSFSIYFLSADRAMGLDLSFLGPITPIGGGILISAWFYLIIRLSKSEKEF